MSDPKPSLKFVPSKSNNPVWSHYEKCTTEDKAKCKTCGSLLSCKGGSTGAMRGHLKAIHSIEVGFKIKPSTPGTSSDATGAKGSYFDHNLKFGVENATIAILTFIWPVSLTREGSKD